MSGFDGYDAWKTASPYDAEGEPRHNCDFAAVFPDFDSPYQLYRAVYKGTDCGASLGFHVRWTVYGDNGESGPGNPGDIEREEWVYNDDLHKLGSWTDMNGADYRIAGAEVFADTMSLSSIVEGVDSVTDTLYVDCDPGSDVEAIRSDFWNACDQVELQARAIWQATHGCEHCWPGTEHEPGNTPINPECIECDGFGEVI